MSVELTTLKMNHAPGGDINHGYTSSEGVDVRDTGPTNVSQMPIHVASGKEDKEYFTGCTMLADKIQTAVGVVFSKHGNEIKFVIKLFLLLMYFAYFGYAMYYKFGDEGSIRLLVCSLLGVMFLLIHIFQRLGRSTIGTFSQKGGLNCKGLKKTRRYIHRFLMVAVFVSLSVYIILDVLLDYPQNAISIAGLLIYVFIFYVFSKSPAKVLPMGVFFYAVTSVLYYLGVMQVVIKKMGMFLAFCLGTTPAESLNAAGNIFFGMTDVPVMIQPFLEEMTNSELHAVMTGGFATIAGSVMGAYITFGVPANHLISASVMSAPAALAISKLAYPETERPKTKSNDYDKMGKSTDRNIIEAISSGASKSVKVIVAIAVNVMAFLAVLEFVNMTLDWFGDRVGIDHLSFQLICSYVFYPIAFFMGTDVPDCRRVAELIGIKTFTNEFVAYTELSHLIENKKNFTDYTAHWNSSSDWYYRGEDIILPYVNQTLKNGIISEKSEVIATYALCGFSNFGSMGIFLGGMSALVPSRRGDLSKLVLRAMIAGNVACFLTGCIAGLLYKDQGST
ncbi:solute carrier family 28 member 3-like isoform X2 [Ostrea edulis]|uniref:solute carrier family 28 member 3-like isoform X2 n=1 Tax=Ostrea edulis TaxID=37623 RepID=UPI0024AFA699|nr:solute carrier family 28 member 3-like isoform X2 [Ostrea edulis]